MIVHRYTEQLGVWLAIIGTPLVDIPVGRRYARAFHRLNKTNDVIPVLETVNMKIDLTLR